MHKVMYTYIYHHLTWTIDIKDLNIEDDKSIIENDTEEKLFRGGVSGLHHLLTDSMEEGKQKLSHVH
jgi:hypothetical protein